MSGEIVAHYEVLDAVSEGHGDVAAIATALVVSASTVRRRCTEMVERGWLARDGRRYVLTERGQQALADNEGW